MRKAARFIDIIADQLIGKTDAGDDVFVPGDWPTYADEYPFWRVQLLNQFRQSRGRGTPVYLTSATFRISGRLQALGDVGDQGLDAETALWAFIDQGEVAVINNPQIMRRVNQIASIRSQINVNAEGAYHLGSVCIDLELEYPEGPEDFFPLVGVPLRELTVSVVEPDHTIRPGLDVHYPPPSS